MEGESAVETILTPELKGKLDALKTKLEDGRELTLNDLNDVVGGANGETSRSAEEDYYYLEKVYKEFGSVVGRNLAVYMYGNELVDTVYGYMPYDEYGNNTLRELVYKVYNTKVGGGVGGNW